MRAGRVLGAMLVLTVTPAAGFATTFLGVHGADGTRTVNDASIGVFNGAHGWRDKIDGAGTDDWARPPGNRVSFLTAEDSQNLVTYTAPVPVPAAGRQLMGTVTGLAVPPRREHA